MLSSLEAAPNPGSKEALVLGCTCPIMDNHYGKGVEGFLDEPVFWMAEGCPVHKSH